MSKFQIVLLVVFGAFIVVAVIVFSQNKSSSGSAVKLSVWGTLSSRDFNEALGASGLLKSDAVSFSYSEKKSETLSADFTKALAEGKGPDLIILPVENLLEDKGKLLVISSDSVKPADFVKTFVAEGELFAAPAGYYALPLYVDPMVLYWNRELLANVSLAKPPAYWDEIYDYIKKLTVKDNAGNITLAALPIGEAKNIPHAKDFLSLLMLEAGTPIVYSSGTSLRSAMLENFGLPQVPSMAALEFYTQFANSQKSYYTWNRSLPEASVAFAGGKAAMYLGFASELTVLKAKNPNLDLGIAPVPQSRASGKVMTFGRLYGVAVARGTKDPAGALAGALALAGRPGAAALAGAAGVVPVRRDILSESPSDPARAVFYGAALQAKGWLDPDPAATESLFGEMIESVTSGRLRVDEAVSKANSALNTLLAR